MSEKRASNSEGTSLLIIVLGVIFAGMVGHAIAVYKWNSWNFWLLVIAIFVGLVYAIVRTVADKSS